MAAIAPSGEDASSELIEPEPIRPGQFDDAVHWRSHRDVDQRVGNVIGRLRLHLHGRKTNGVAVGVRVGDAAEKLKKLRCAENGVGTDAARTASSWASFAR